jgi:hypothetical protein
MTHTVGRRRLLQGTALCAIAPWRWPVPRTGLASAQLAALGASACILFADPEAARMVGALYLREHRGETGLDCLDELLPAGSDPARALPQWLGARRPLELADDDVAIVAGWVLAASEARLCALLHLAAIAA